MNLSTQYEEDDGYSSRQSLSLPKKNHLKGNIKLDPEHVNNRQKDTTGEPNCCFVGIFGGNSSRGQSSKGALKKKTSKGSTNDDISKLSPLSKMMLQTFQEYLPKYASSMEWVEHFVSLAKKALQQNSMNLMMILKEFEASSNGIYSQVMVNVGEQKEYFVDQPQIVEEQQEIAFQTNLQHFEESKTPNGDLSRKETRQELKFIVNQHMQDYQMRLFFEIELQLTNVKHPVNILINQCFNEAFMQHYKQYVVKSSAQGGGNELLDKIIKKTVGMQTDYVYKLSAKFEKANDEDLQLELEKKSMITLSNQAIDDVKVFFSSLLMIVRKIYDQYIDYQDYEELKEDIAKLVINLILKDDVLKVLTCLLRIDTFDQDKDLREKYQVLKGVQTSDFGIDPYLSLNDAGVFFQELFKKYNIEATDAATDITQQQMNTTLQTQN